MWDLLFERILLLANDEKTDINFKGLPASWAKQLTDVQNSTVVKDRGMNTLTLEILANVPSPESFKTERLHRQVELMQSQMLSSEVIDLKALLAEWLTLGSLTKQDIPYIERVKSIFIS